MDRSSLLESPLNSLSGLNLGGMSAGSLSSPFLQVDPSLVGTPRIANEFIFPDGGTKSTRGRFELAFAQIGGSIMSGAAFGGLLGTFKGKYAFFKLIFINFWIFLGLREVATMQETLSIKRTHLLNYVSRNGARVGNAFGSIALVYSVLGVGLSFVPGVRDEVNTGIAATTTGTLYGALSKTKAMEPLQGIYSWILW
jgi:hypothetical protein